MKKLILATTILAMAGMNVQKAKAGDCEWATAGQILTGVVAGAVIASAINSHAGYSVGYSYGVPAYCPPPMMPPRAVYVPASVVYAPPPAVVFQAQACAPWSVVAVNFGYRGGHHHGWKHSHHW